tara:strand:- start:38 stop:556 length:519 start_codon:yes stop_codon:yes gene_type:complete
VKYNNCGSCCPADVNNPSQFYLSCDETTPIAVQSFMAYSGCPSMYTTGQADRMVTSLQSQYRNNLWSQSNQIATGVWNCNPTSTSNLSKDLFASVSPNPFKDGFTLDYIPKGLSNITITTITGKVVLSLNIQSDQLASNKQWFDLNQEKSGIYFINLNYTDGNVVSKYLVKK